MKNCKVCRWAVHELLAPDDERLFCSSPQIPHGYVSLSGSDGECCVGYSEGTPVQEDLLVDPEHRTYTFASGSAGLIQLGN